MLRSYGPTLHQPVDAVCLAHEDGFERDRVVENPIQRAGGCIEFLRAAVQEETLRNRKPRRTCCGCLLAGAGGNAFGEGIRFTSPRRGVPRHTGDLLRGTTHPGQLNRFECSGSETVGTQLLDALPKHQVTDSVSVLPTDTPTALPAAPTRSANCAWLRLRPRRTVRMRTS